MVIKLKDIVGMIEYKGDMVTPEELATLLGVDMEYEITV